MNNVAVLMIISLACLALAYRFRPPFRPVTSIHAKSRARHPSAGKEPDGLDPPSAS